MLEAWIIFLGDERLPKVDFFGQKILMEPLSIGFFDNVIDFFVPLLILC